MNPKPARRRVLIAVVLAVAAVVWAGVAPMPVLAASNRLVNPATGADTGNCTVNKCRTITYAQTQSVDGDTIVLDGTCSGGCVYAEKPTITRALPIQGAPAATSLIGPASPTSGITLTINVGAAKSVTISNVTIRNGVGGLFLQTGS